MRNIVRMLAVTIITVFAIPSSGAAVTSSREADASAAKAPAIPAGFRGGGFRSGGGFHPAPAFRGGGGFRGGGLRSSGRSFHSSGSNGRSFSRGRSLSHRGSSRRATGGHVSRQSHTGNRNGHASHHVNTHAFHGHNAHAGNTSSHGNSHVAGQHYNHSAGVTRAHVGQITHGRFGAHALSHQVLGSRHRGLVGHTAKRPGDHLRGRLANLHGHRWHQHFKHVAIVWAFGGAVACDVYCDFDVPVDVYGDFVEAVAEAEAEDAEAAAFAQQEAGLAAVPAQDLPRRRAERSRGWNKAVAILEEAAADEDKKAAAGQHGGGEVEAVIDQPDETVDVVLDDNGQKKGS